MSELFAKFDEVVLGWILGLLSTPLVMYATAIVEKRRFKDVLKEELREVRFRLAVMVYTLRDHLRELNRPTLEWVAAEFEIYSDSPERNRMLEMIRQLLNQSDQQLELLAKRPRNLLGTKAVPRVVIPYLSSRLESISLMCSNQQKQLINLIHYVEVINVKSGELADWNKLTFDVSSMENHTLASNNIDSSIQAISVASEKAVDYIKNYFS